MKGVTTMSRLVCPTCGTQSTLRGKRRCTSSHATLVATSEYWRIYDRQRKNAMRALRKFSKHRQNALSAEE